VLKLSRKVDECKPLLWGDDGVWYRGEMHEVNMASGASIMYPDTGETEEVGPRDNTSSVYLTKCLCVMYDVLTMCNYWLHTKDKTSSACVTEPVCDVIHVTHVG
jgi:hypothetical protein